tara:strand:- start:695 stop:1078 length:384 start_codon:yes stop_codon:yes gene_type:complete
MNRDEHVLLMRPEIKTINQKIVQSDVEKFQNEVLRPVIKFQHDLIIIIFETHLRRKHVELAAFSLEKKVTLVEEVFMNDRLLINELKGVIVACFTCDEYLEYNLSLSEINKRISQIIKVRVLNTLFK